MRLLQSILILFALLIFHTRSYAQERCATVVYEKIKQTTGNVIETKEQFEKALSAKLKVRKRNFNKLLPAAPYRIPVVVHVIHSEERGVIGQGGNISDAQIVSQIDVINKDFKRLNADGDDTPAEFEGVAGSIDIEFVLARQDPEGLYTTGINRVYDKRNQWTLGREAELKALSYWPSEDYLNIWVTNFISFVGYAQFPVSSGLAGLENANDNRLTDGIIVDYTAFGTIDAGPFDLDDQYNRGRSTTHEIGHFLGLRHIWGDDDNCTGTDYVDDTPNQADETYECPSNPETDCGAHKMFQNYMDYTDDVCMNLFTQGQVERMITVLENSPRRTSLLTSHGLEDPILGDIDVEVAEISSPVPVTCDRSPEVKFTLNNEGVNPITSFKVRITVNPFIKDTTFTGLSFTGSAEFSIPFEKLNLPEDSDELSVGDNTVTVNIIAINGKADTDYTNNEKSTQIHALSDCNSFALYVDETGTPVITFALAEVKPVEISLINMMGQEITRVQYSDIQNQTIALPVVNRMNNVYIVRLRIGTRYYSRKVYLHP